MSVLIELNSPQYKKSLERGLSYKPLIRVTSEFGKYKINSESNFMLDHIVKCYTDGLGQKRVACSCPAGQFDRFCQHIAPVVEFHKPLAAAKKVYEAELAAEAFARIKAGTPQLKARLCAFEGCGVKLTEGREHCFLHTIGSRVGETFSPKTPCRCHKCGGRSDSSRPGYGSLMAHEGWYYHAACIGGK